MAAVREIFATILAALRAVTENNSASGTIRQKLLGGSGWALIGRSSQSLLGLALSALLARLLTTEAMGAYFLTLSFVSFFVVLGKLGLNQMAVKLIAESMGIGDTGRTRAATHKILVLGIFGGLFSAGIVFFGIGGWVARNLFHSVAMESVVVAAAIWIFVLTIQGLLEEIFRGFHSIHRAVLTGGLITRGATISLFLGAWWVQTGIELTNVVTLSVVAVVLNLFVALFWLGRLVRRLDRGSGSVAIREIFALAGPFLLTNLMLFALVNAHLWVIGNYLADDYVALYGAAASLVKMVAMPLLIINAVVPPIIAELHARGEITKLELTLRLSASVVGIPALLILLAFIFLGRPILNLVFGVPYENGAVILAVLSVGHLAFVFFGSCGLALMITGHQRTMMTITLVTGPLSILASILVVRTYGSIGVAAVLAATIIIQNVLQWIMARRYVGVWTHAFVSPRRIMDAIRTRS